jgi:hypothetical protein
MAVTFDSFCQDAEVLWPDNKIFAGGARNESIDYSDTDAAHLKTT